MSRLRAAGITSCRWPIRYECTPSRGCSYEAKTDPLDACVLARYGQVFSTSDPCPSESEEEREELQQLLRRRR